MKTGAQNMNDVSRVVSNVENALYEAVEFFYFPFRSPSKPVPADVGMLSNEQVYTWSLQSISERILQTIYIQLKI